MAWTRSTNDGFSWHRRYPGTKLVFEVKNNSFIAQANNNSINTLIIFLAEGSSQLREWLRDCVRDCWQAVWKIFQLWWIGRLLISRWVFVVSRLNYPGPGLRPAQMIRPIRGPGWGESANQKTSLWHMQYASKKIFLNTPFVNNHKLKVHLMVADSTSPVTRIISWLEHTLNWQSVTHGTRTVRCTIKFTLSYFDGRWQF